VLHEGFQLGARLIPEVKLHAGGVVWGRLTSSAPLEHAVHDRVQYGLELLRHAHVILGDVRHLGRRAAVAGVDEDSVEWLRCAAWKAANAVGVDPVLSGLALPVEGKHHAPILQAGQQ